jgi:hypothetical protein
VALRGQHLMSRTNVYHRLAGMAARAGFRLSWPSAESGISLWVSIVEGLNPKQCEAFLSRANRDRCLDAADTAYDRGAAILGLNGVAHSLGAAAVIDRWHNQPPTILRRIELAGCIGTPQLAVCLAQARRIGSGCADYW